MFIGGTSERGQTYAPPTSKGETVAAVSREPAGTVVSSEAAPFLSPAVNFNYEAGIAVFVIRDGETGEIRSQYPSQKVVEEYIRHGAASQQDGSSGEATNAAQAVPPVTGSAPVADPGAPAVAAAVMVAPAPAPAATGAAPAAGPHPTSQIA